MFNYNWKYLYTLSNKNPKLIMEVLKRYYHECIFEIDEATRIIAELSQKEKPSYILDLKGLVLDTEYSDGDKVIYLYVASLRSLSDYMLYGRDYLNKNLVEIDMSIIESIGLFTVQGNYIKFKY